MVELQSPGRLPVSDYIIQIVGKLLSVMASRLLVPSVLAIVVFCVLLWMKLDRIAVCFGQGAFAIALMYCFFTGFAFNSKRAIRAICAARSKHIPLYSIPHPVVRDLSAKDTLYTRVHRRCAIAVIETKSYTIAYGLAYLIFYLSFLYFLRAYDPGSLKCSGECEVGWYWIKLIGTGPLFDFFETFQFSLTNVEDGSYLFEGASYAAKIVSALVSLQTLLVYFEYRRRFRWVLRPEAKKGMPSSMPRDD